MNDGTGVHVLHNILAVLYHMFTVENASSVLHTTRRGTEVTGDGEPIDPAALIADHIAYFYRAETVTVLIQLVVPFFLGPATSPDQRVLAARVLAGLHHLLSVFTHGLNQVDDIYRSCWWALQNDHAQTDAGDSASGDSDEDDSDEEDSDEESETSSTAENDISMTSAAESPRRVRANIDAPSPSFVLLSLLEAANDTQLLTLTPSELWSTIEKGLAETSIDKNGDIELDLVGQKAWLVLSREALSVQKIKLTGDSLPNSGLRDQIAGLLLSDDADVEYLATEVAINVLSHENCFTSGPITEDLEEDEQLRQLGKLATPTAALQSFCAPALFSRFVQGLLRVLNNQHYPFRNGKETEAMVVRVIQVVCFLCREGARTARHKTRLEELNRPVPENLLPEIYSNDRKVLLEIVCREVSNLPGDSPVLYFYIEMANEVLKAYHDEVVEDCKAFFDALREMLVAEARGVNVAPSTLKIADQVLIAHDTLEYDDEEDESD